MTISVLDCTLREGGYVNNWNFGNERPILQALDAGGIDYIECGFLKNVDYKKGYTIFDSPQKIVELSSAKRALMINYGEMPLECIPDNLFGEFYLRVAFRKNDRHDAIKYCKHIQDKGYGVFVNSMAVNSYCEEEFDSLISDINNLRPYAYTLSDTFGSMQMNDVINLFKKADNALSCDIKLDFHSHNNMQLAFSNSQLFLEQNTSRDIIIDSTLMGIGRGAGNLSTEMIVRYLNFKYGKNYNIEMILNIIEQEIQPIYNQTPWGYSLPYYISAINGCHPNYAKYMSEELKLNIEQIYDIMKKIPEDKKLIFDKSIVANFKI